VVAIDRAGADTVGGSASFRAPQSYPARCAALEDRGITDDLRGHYALKNCRRCRLTGSGHLRPSGVPGRKCPDPAAHGCEGPQTLTHGSVIAVILERRSIQLSQLAGPFWRKPHAIFCSLKLRQMPGVFTPSPDHRNDLLV